MNLEFGSSINIKAVCATLLSGSTVCGVIITGDTICSLNTSSQPNVKLTSISAKTTETAIAYLTSDGCIVSGTSTGGGTITGGTNGLGVDGANICLGGTLDNDTVVDSTGSYCLTLGDTTTNVGKIVIDPLGYLGVAMHANYSNICMYNAVNIDDGAAIIWTTDTVTNATGQLYVACNYVSLYSDNGSGKTTQFCVDPSNALMNSSDSSFKGIEYNDDFSANYTARSLVDKAYVTGQTASKLNTSIYQTYTGTTAPATYLPYTLTTDWQDPTGWVDNSNINVSYNYANRTITLTGNLDYYWQGEKRTLTSPWTSSAHTNTVGAWFLYSTDGTNINWSQSVWNFTDLMVVVVNYKNVSGTTFALRETHGMMPWSTHRDLHKNIGTFLNSGGLATSWTANTATDAANSPNFNTATIVDEDNQTTISGITKGSYTLMRISGNTSIYTVDHATPFSGATNQFIRVNDPTTGGWTAGINARYYNIYQILVPTTSDVTSQKFRTIFLQPQATFATLAGAQAEDTRGLALGSLTSESPEFIPFARVTYLTANANNNYGKVTIPTGGITYVVGNRMGSTSVAGVSSSNHATLSNLSWASSGHLGTNNTLAGFDGSGNACSSANMTFDGTQLKVTGNICATTCLRSPLISGDTACATTCIKLGDAIACKLEMGFIAGSPTICFEESASEHCMKIYQQNDDGFLSIDGTSIPTILTITQDGKVGVRSPNPSATFQVNGSSCVTGLSTSCIVCGTSCLSAPIISATTCSTAPIVCASNCMCVANKINVKNPSKTTRDVNIGNGGLYSDGNLEMAIDKSFFIGPGSLSDSGTRFKLFTAGCHAYFDYYDCLCFRSGPVSSTYTATLSSGGTLCTNQAVCTPIVCATTCFIGSGAGLTGTASSLSIGGNANNATCLGGLGAGRYTYGCTDAGSCTAPITFAASATTMWKSGFWEINGATWTPTTDWYWGLTAAHTSNSSGYNYSLQFIGNGTGTGAGCDFYLRTIGAGTPTSWKRIWTNCDSSLCASSCMVTPKYYSVRSTGSATLPVMNFGDSLGGTCTDNLSIGNSGAADVIFLTNNAEKARISSAGRFTICSGISEDVVSLIANTSSTGYGIAVSAGSSTRYILALRDYQSNEKFLFRADGYLCASTCVITPIVCGSTALCSPTTITSTVCATGTLEVCGANSCNIRLITNSAYVLQGLPSSCTSLYYSGTEKLKTLTNGTCISGCAFATDYALSSDLALKTNIKPINISPINVEYKQFNFKSDDERLRYGVIAQELIESNPELVSVGDDGLLNVSYTDLLIKEIAYLKCRVSELEKKIM